MPDLKYDLLLLYKNISLIYCPIKITDSIRSLIHQMRIHCFSQMHINSPKVHPTSTIPKKPKSDTDKPKRANIFQSWFDVVQNK